MNHCIVYVVLFAFIFSQPLSALAIDLDQGFSGPASSEAEFFSSNREKRMTIQINFVSGVQRPGVHHLPDNTHLLEAISLAGGVQTEADLSKVLVKRKKKDKFETIQYDLTDIVTDKDLPYPELRNNDTIVIGSKSRAAEGTLLGLSIAASLVAIVSGYLVITKKR